MESWERFDRLGTRGQEPLEHVRVGPWGLGISLMGSACAKAAGGEEG